MSIIIYDIETSDVDTQKAVPRLMGFYSSKVAGFQWTSDIEAMRDILNAHDIIVGFNSEDYDNAIMKRYGLSMYGKISIDLMKIIHGKGFGNDLGRKNICMVGKTRLADILPDKKMKTLGEALGCPHAKLDDNFDYNHFKVEFSQLSDEIQAKCIEYLQNDVEITKFIFEYLEDFFSFFRDGSIVIDGQSKRLCKPEQVSKKQYLTWSTASLVYHVLCNLCDLTPTFQDGKEKQDYGGGYVAFPKKSYVEGDIYCLDFSSLYPHIMIMCNLYGRTYGEGWNGYGVFETKGTYNDQNLVSVSKVLQKLYAERKERKKAGDTSEYTIKIIINTMYGLLGNPVFAQVHDYVAAEDCTMLGQQFIKFARHAFSEAGYELLYTDTDSVYIRDPYGNEKRVLETRDNIINFIKQNVPFPQDTFDMDIDDYIKRIYFFKNESGDYLKKNYVYLTKEDKLKVKGLQIIKSNATKLGKKIFFDHIAPKIKENGQYLFKKSQIELWIESALLEDMSLVSNSFRVKPWETYANESQIQAQISKHFGEGTHQMVKINRSHPQGIGRANNYITLEKAREVHMSWFDLGGTWNELRHFIEPQKSLEAFF